MTWAAAGAESKWITLGALLALKRSERFLSGAEPTDLAAKPDPDAGRAFAPYPFAYEPADERRVRDAWKTLGVGEVLDRLVAFAGKRVLATGWHWGFVMGPEFCREWLAATPRWIPRRGMRQSWPVSRVFFLSRRGQFTEEGLARKLGIPVEDEHEKPRFKEVFWRALWRVRIAKWRDPHDEVGVTIRDPKELTRLLRVMDAALGELPRE